MNIKAYYEKPRGKLFSGEYRHILSGILMIVVTPIQALHPTPVPPNATGCTLGGLKIKDLVDIPLLAAKPSPGKAEI